ncbi:MAG: sensor domain-containing diguanylate cyclase [Hyphomonadaceae bacterium]|nr:sensor domain-containing diguanylate cyclase [Hyphomonadaceae bacterium]
MISYPPPKFEEQKSEILQRYQILSEDDSKNALCIADSIALALNVPFVIAALNRRYRKWYHCDFGLGAYPESDLQTYFARMHLSQSRFEAPDVEAEAFFTQHTTGLRLPKFKSIAGVPLTDPNGKRFGTLCIADRKVRQLSEAELSLLTSFGRVVSNDICVRSAARYAVRDLVELEHEKCDLFELATIDPLTKALNRRAFMRFSERELARFKRDQGQLSALMLDIDHFKQVNDVHGHATGDKVLAKLVSVATNVLRQEDLIGRLGGEEFAIVLVDSDAQAAAKVADRIRQTIKQVKFPSETGPFNVSVSIGVSEPFYNESSINDALERADAALYNAKRNGRDRVELATENVALMDPPAGSQVAQTLPN